MTRFALFRSSRFLILTVLIAIALSALVVGFATAEAQSPCGGDPRCVSDPGGTYDPDGGGPGAPNVDVTANPATIYKGNSSVVSWTSENAEICFYGPNNDAIGTSGSFSVSPMVTTSYTIQCVNAGGQGEDSATVTVIDQPAPSASLSANPSTINLGQSSTLTWGSTNATSCTGSGFSTGGATSGSASVAPGSNANYSVTCSGPGGNASAYASITVITPISASCSVNPSSIATGGSAIWSAYVSGGNGSYSYSWSGSEGLSGSSQSISKSYASAGTKNASVTITSGAQLLTQACSALTVTDTPQPQEADLTTGGVSAPSTALVGQVVSLSAAATNIGGASSGSFPVLFQVGNTNLESGYVGGLSPGNSGWAGVSHQFNAPGEYMLRACANFNTSWTAITPESNYGNNCGPWTTITVSEEDEEVPPPPPAGSLSCSASESSLPSGGGSVTFSASGASSPYTWSSSDGEVTSGPMASRTFTDDGSYSMTVSKNGFASGTCFVDVGTVSCGTADATITASRMRVRQGETTTLSWSASGVDDSCTISGPGVSQTIPGNTCVVPNGSATPTINTQSVYRITCDGGEATDEVVVNVIPRFEEF